MPQTFMTGVIDDGCDRTSRLYLKPYRRLTCPYYLHLGIDMALRSQYEDDDSHPIYLPSRKGQPISSFVS
jgi:hypothetical protein